LLQLVDTGRDLVKVDGHRSVIRLELVDHRPQLGVRLEQGREQSLVFERVMTVHETAVVHAVHSQLPQRPAGLQ
jgi:hypothetical protein